MKSSDNKVNRARKHIRTIRAKIWAPKILTKLKDKYLIVNLSNYLKYLKIIEKESISNVYFTSKRSAQTHRALHHVVQQFN